MNLTEEQIELLHAWVDGETTDAEDQLVEMLLRQDSTCADTQEYLTELQRLRELLASHAGVEVPQGLRSRVKTALACECRDDGDVVHSPFLSRRPVLMGIAAILVLCLALAYSPTLVAPDNAPDRIATADRIGSTDDFRLAANLGSVVPKETKALATTHKISGQNIDADTAPPDNIAPRTLSLDRGVDQPFELCLHMTRNERVSNLLVYNDLLLICNLYGDARLRESRVDHDQSFHDQDFDARDFTTFDGVNVRVLERRLKNLITSIDRLIDVQSYGRIVVPADVRRYINRQSETIDGMQEHTARLMRRAKGISESEPARTQPVFDNERPFGYLPLEIQNARLRRLIDGVGTDMEISTVSAVSTAEPTGRRLSLIVRLR